MSHAPLPLLPFLNAIFIQISLFFYSKMCFIPVCALLFRQGLGYIYLFGHANELNSKNPPQTRFYHFFFYIYITLCFQLFIKRLSLLFYFFPHPSTLKLLYILGLRTNQKQPCSFFFFFDSVLPCLSPNHPFISSQPPFVLFEYGM